MPIFRRDPKITRQIGFVDLLFACFITFVLFPAFIFALGYSPILLRDTSEPEGLWAFAGLLVILGYTGLFAWAAMPLALLAGWWATRTGWLGWASTLGLGGIAGAIFSLIFIGGTDVREINAEALPIAGFCIGVAMIYAAVGYLALSWLRSDLLGRRRATSE